VQKYARATNVNVRLVANGGVMTLEVEDDGIGFDPVTTARGAGLQNMADRLDSLGGSLDVDGSPGRGTRLRGRLPIPVPSAVAE
jgi:signal transduction histidine kinase